MESATSGMETSSSAASAAMIGERGDGGASKNKNDGRSQRGGRIGFHVKALAFQRKTCGRVPVG
jgi:hypothetical protein